MSEMKISIITLTWNSEKTIADTVKSIQSQTFDNYEHVIIDNVSSDRTLEIVRELYSKDSEKLKIVSESDQGISDGFNKGILNSDGEIVVFLNSDDTYISKNVLEDIYKEFKDPSIMYVHGDMIFEDDDYGTNTRKPLLCSLEKAMPYNHPTFFVRRKLYDDHGLFNLDYKYTMDFHFICRLYSDVTTPLYKSVYFDKYPLVRMRAGGVSWKYEQNSLKELEKGLKEFGFYTNVANKHIRSRLFRIKLREALGKIGFNFIVILWRKWKWRD